LMKVVGLLAVVALLLGALPLQAKAQASSPNPTFLTVDVEQYNDDESIVPSENIDIKWERNPIMGAKSGSDVVHVVMQIAPSDTIDYAMVGIQVNFKLTADTEISYWGYTASGDELAPGEIWLLFENGEVICDTDPNGEVGEWVEWTLSESEEWFDPTAEPIATVAIEDYYDQTVVGVFLGVGAPTSTEGTTVDVYLDNLTIDADGDETNEYVLDDDTGRIDVLESIQVGIDAALPGDTLNIWPFYFEENLTIDKPLTLKAAALMPEIAPQVSTVPLIRITSKDVYLRNLFMHGSDVLVEVNYSLIGDEEALDSISSTNHLDIKFCELLPNEEGTTTYIKNLTGFTVLAENNWWGDPNGPVDGGFIGSVDYVPWWRGSVDEFVLDPSEIKENEPAGTQVGTFTISDEVEEDNVFTLELVDPESLEFLVDNELFTIEGFNLKTAAELNHEDGSHEDGSYVIYVRVTDAWGNIWEQHFPIEVTDVNDPPVLTLPDDLPTEINEGETISFDAEAEDEDGGTFTFSLVGKPSGATINSGTGVFSWTPDEAQGPGTYSFTVKVCDDGLPELCDEQAVTIKVNELNQAPLADVDEYTVLKGTKLVVPAPGVLGNDTDADEPKNDLTAAKVSGPNGGVLVLNPNGSFEFTPPEDAEAGEDFVFTYRVSDGKGGLDDEIVTLSIKDSNNDPLYIYVDPAEKLENVDYVGELGVYDDDPAEPSLHHIYSFLGGTGGEDNAQFTIVGNKLIAKAPFDYETKDEYHVLIRATDFFGEYTDDPLTITVLDANDAPVLAEIGDKAIDEGRNLTFTASASDKDTNVGWNVLTFSLEGAPSTASIATRYDEDEDIYYGDFSWRPAENEGPNEYTFDVCVSDSGGAKDCETITVTVNEVNVAPYWNTTLPEGFSISEEAESHIINLSAYAIDEDVPAQTLTFSLAGEVPAGAKIVKNADLTSWITWKPTEEQGPGTYPFDVCVSDGVADPVCETITITVGEVNSDPVAKPDFYAVTSSRLEVPSDKGVLANDSDKDIPANILTVSQVGSLTGLTLYPDGHFVYAKPGDSTVEYVTFTYTVSDGTDVSEEATVTLLLKNSPPVSIILTPSEVAEDEKVIGELTTVDPNGVADVHTYSFVDTCEGGALDNSEFTIGPAKVWGEPVDYALIAKNSLDYETRNSYSVCVRSTDLFGKYVDEKLDIRVTDVNEAVAISQEVTTEAGQPIEITLEGFDPEGDELTYAIFSFPKHGTLDVNEVNGINFVGNGVQVVVENLVAYTPDPDFAGEDSFTFKVMDSHGLVSNLATVTITVGAAPTQQFIFLQMIIK